MIPSSYQAWRHCIERDCGLALSASYIDERIRSLRNTQDFRTEQFIRRYGAAYHAQVLAWFAHAAAEQATS